MSLDNSRRETRSENNSENKGAKPGFTTWKLVYSWLKFRSWSRKPETEQEGYEFFNALNKNKFLGLQSMNFYILSISTLIFHFETKKSCRIQYFEIFRIFGKF